MRVASGPGSSVTVSEDEIPPPLGRRIRSGSTRARDRLFGAQRTPPGKYRAEPSGGQDALGSHPDHNRRAASGGLLGNAASLPALRQDSRPERQPSGDVSNALR